MIGQTISHYKILEKLGEGGMGVVYKAHDTKLDRDVALKFLPQQITVSDEDKARFLQEARAISALNHPNIATIHDIDEVDGQKFLVLEFIPGGTLKSKLKYLKSEDKEFSLNEVLEYGIQAAEALAHAHRHQIIHRDIKTDNLMLTDEGKVKLTDFGLAKLRGSGQVTKTGTTVGTAAYMSPEQIRGEEVDQRSDIFSLGVVLYELLTLHLPFRGEFETALNYSVLNENPPPVKSLRKDTPAALEKVIDRCLEKDAAKRPQSMHEVMAMLKGELRPQASVVRKFRPLYKWIVITIITLAFAGGLSQWLKGCGGKSPVGGANQALIGILKFSSDDPVVVSWPSLMQWLFQGRLTTSRVRVYEITSLNYLLESKFGSISPKRTPDLYRKLDDQGITHVLDGNISSVGKFYTIYFNIINPATGRPIYSHVDTLERIDDLQKVVDALSWETLKYLSVESGQTADMQAWLPRSRMHLDALIEFEQAYDILCHSDSGSAKYLERALQYDSTFITPHIWLISGYGHRKSMRKAAEDHYKTVLRLEPQASPFEKEMISWSRAYLDYNLAEEARCLERALKYEPGNNILLVNLGEIYCQLGNIQMASDRFNQAVMNKFPYPSLYPAAAECDIRLNKHKEAKEVLLSATAMEPVDPATYCLMAALESQSGADSTSVKRLVEMAVATGKLRNQTKDSTLIMVGDYYMLVGCCKNAVDLFRQVVALKPDSPIGHEYLANALYNLKNLNESIMEYQRAFELDPHSPDILFMIAKIKEERGDTAGSLREYQKYLRLDSTSERAQRIHQRF